MVKNKLTHVLRSSILAVFLTGTTISYAENTSKNTANLGEALNILLGAYNGAATAAAENKGIQANTIDRSDLKPLEDKLTRYQKELQGMIKADGEVDTIKLGHFLNRLQRENKGELSYDFAQALHALQGLSPDDDPQALLNQQVLNELVFAAKNQELHRELSQTVPYLGAILQIGSLMNQGKSADSNALSAEISALKALAEHQIGSSDLTQDIRNTAAQLKIIFADQMLNEPVSNEDIKIVKKRLDKLQKRVLEASPQTVPTSIYDVLLRPLSALGEPFSQQYDQWLGLRTISLHEQSEVAYSGEFDAQTRKLLDALNYDQLPPHVQRELLKRLNITAP